MEHAKDHGHGQQVQEVLGGHGQPPPQHSSGVGELPEHKVAVGSREGQELPPPGAVAVASAAAADAEEGGRGAEAVGVDRDLPRGSDAARARDI